MGAAEKVAKEREPETEEEMNEMELEHTKPVARDRLRPPFALSAKFLAGYRERKPKFGFNGLGELVYQRTYSRTLEDGSKEQWWQTVARVVNGTYNMQRQWIDQHELGWNPWTAQRRRVGGTQRVATDGWWG